MASASLAEPTEHYCAVDDGDCDVVEVRCGDRLACAREAPPDSLSPAVPLCGGREADGPGRQRH
jgi:hypothetical protein